MGKRKLKLPFFLSRNYNNTVTPSSRSASSSSSSSSSTSSISSWPWPSCHQPKTLSFRINTNDSNIIKTYVETASSSMFESPSYLSSEDESGTAESSLETVVRGLKSNESRLFFEPGKTSSILDEAKPDVNSNGGEGDGVGSSPFKESMVLSMESRDPYADFKKSMEEMVEAHGLKEWEDLEELLCWYLRVNEKSNHGFIVVAFVELLIAISSGAKSSTTTGGGDSMNNINNDVINTSSSSSSSTCSNFCFSNSREYSPSSPLSFYTSSCSSSDYSSSTPCVSSSLEIEEIDDSSPPPPPPPLPLPCLSSLLAIEETRHDHES